MNKLRAASAGVFVLIAGALTACAPAAVVVVSRDYDLARVQRVSLAAFADFPGAPGSGALAASTFEKYLLTAGYRLVDRAQAEAALQQNAANSLPGELPGDVDPSQIQAQGKLLGVDALALGTLTDYTGSRDQTVMVDIPQEQTDPIYGQVTTVQGRRDDRTVTTQNVVTGYATTTTDQVVPETETVPAHAAMTVRLVDASTGELLWSVSSSASGDDLASATESASSSAMQAVAKRLKSLPAPAKK
jgi:hypothetical protein